jgi:hypothetical protein
VSIQEATCYSEKQHRISLSSHDSVAESQCDVECVYLRRLMPQIVYKQNTPTPITKDDVTCIYVTQQARMYHKTKHIDTCVYKVRELSSGDHSEVK